jgi:D-alanyl-D-alanine carboxypeptidase
MGRSDPPARSRHRRDRARPIRLRGFAEARWLPGILPYGDQVDLRQLLNVTGGVPDHQRLLEPKVLADLSKLTRSYSPRELVAMVADRQPDFAPATSWNYSSTNSILTGLIIERAT